MVNADLGVAGAGTTSWEMCFLGLPSILIVLADNQRFIAKELDARGMTIQLDGDRDFTAHNIKERLAKLIASSPLRKSMSTLGRGLVDGLGTERVMQELMLT